jgi:hypothetical protein
VEVAWRRVVRVKRGAGREESVDTMLGCCDGREQMSVNILCCVDLTPESLLLCLRGCIATTI